MKKIIDGWRVLSHRERIMLIAGSVIVFFLLGYTLLWNPLTAAVNQLREQITSQENLYHWMQHANQKIQQLKQLGVSDTKNDNEELLASVERSLTDKKLAQYLQQVQQPEKNKLVLKFQQVPFDQLMQWMQSLLKYNNIKVVKLHVERDRMAGIVNILLVLTNPD